LILVFLEVRSLKLAFYRILDAFDMAAAEALHLAAELEVAADGGIDPFEGGAQIIFDAAVLELLLIAVEF
jgi:hypothetical protein